MALRRLNRFSVKAESARWVTPLMGVGHPGLTESAPPRGRIESPGSDPESAVLVTSGALHATLRRGLWCYFVPAPTVAGMSRFSAASAASVGGQEACVDTRGTAVLATLRANGWGYFRWSKSCFTAAVAALLMAIDARLPRGMNRTARFNSCLVTNQTSADRATSAAGVTSNGATAHSP